MELFIIYFFLVHIWNKVAFIQFASFSQHNHCVKSVSIWSYSGPHFPTFGLPYSVRLRENADQNNSEYGHFSRGKPIHLEIWIKQSITSFNEWFTLEALKWKLEVTLEVTGLAYSQVIIILFSIFEINALDCYNLHCYNRLKIVTDLALSICIYKAKGTQRGNCWWSLNMQ